MQNTYSSLRAHNSLMCTFLEQSEEHSRFVYTSGCLSIINDTRVSEGVDSCSRVNMAIALGRIIGGYAIKVATNTSQLTVVVRRRNVDIDLGKTIVLNNKVERCDEAHRITDQVDAVVACEPRCMHRDTVDLY